jgi:hypothetical protein
MATLRRVIREPSLAHSGCAVGAGARLRYAVGLRFLANPAGGSTALYRVSSCPSPETYRSRLMEKLGLYSIPALVKFALQSELIHLE